MVECSHNEVLYSIEDDHSTIADAKISKTQYRADEARHKRTYCMIPFI